MQDSEIRERLLQATLARRSALYRWVWEHSDELALHVRQARSWQTIASVAKEDGLTASRQSVQATWKRVQKDKRRGNGMPSVRGLPAMRPTMNLERPSMPDLGEFELTDLSGRPIRHSPPVAE